MIQRCTFFVISNVKADRYSSNTFVISIPVISSIAFGNLTTISNNSPVILDAPTAPLPLDTIVTLSQEDNGAATSAATLTRNTQQEKISVKSIDGGGQCTHLTDANEKCL